MSDSVLLRAGRKDPIYSWKKYEVNTSTTYTWNRWNRVDTTVYRWNKYNVVNTYTWNRYNTKDVYKANISSSSYSFTYDGSYITVYTAYSPSWHNNEACLRVSLDDKKEVRISGSSPVTIDGYWYNTTIDFNTSFGSAWFSRLYHLTKTTGSRNCVADELITCRKTIGYDESTVTTVTSSSSSAYPDNGVHTDGYWYKKGATTYSKGSTSYGQVTSTSSSAYPSNGVSGSYWYVSAGSEVQYSKGSSKYSDVTSTNSTAYPDNGYSGSYWYDNKQTVINYSMGNYIEDVFSLAQDTYPANGIAGSYWYVYQGQI
ncbi:hypothetical protein [uncultured Duncaniella sp.]|uniref:hypothetical protein n=1 Tax=uncultured Duncaniella sp. TaxID=2768039 RepID=UPI0026141963|nr:hypothetical protein [uncultured Duncaniella sp.]